MIFEQTQMGMGGGRGREFHGTHPYYQFPPLLLLVTILSHFPLHIGCVLVVDERTTLDSTAHCY